MAVDEALQSAIIQLNLSVKLVKDTNVDEPDALDGNLYSIQVGRDGSVLGEIEIIYNSDIENNYHVANFILDQQLSANERADIEKILIGYAVKCAETLGASTLSITAYPVDSTTFITSGFKPEAISSEDWDKLDIKEKLEALYQTFRGNETKEDFFKINHLEIPVVFELAKQKNIDLLEQSIPKIAETETEAYVNEQRMRDSFFQAPQQVSDSGKDEIEDDDYTQSSKKRKT